MYFPNFKNETDQGVPRAPISMKEETMAPALNLIQNYLLSLSVLGGPNHAEKANQFFDILVSRVVVETPSVSSSEESEDDPVDYFVPCVPATLPDESLPILEGASMRKEVKHVVIGIKQDHVLLSMGECELPKAAPVIKTPVSNLMFPAPVLRVDNPQLKLLSCGVSSVLEEPALLKLAYGATYEKSVSGYKISIPTKSWGDFYDTKDSLKPYISDIEVSYPAFRAGAPTDSYYHPLDPGKFQRDDHDANARGYALEQIMSGFSDDAKIGVITTNDAHYDRLIDLFGNRVYIPVMEEMVDVVLYDPYGRCWTWVDGASVNEVFRRKIAKRAPLWAHVKHYVAPVDKVNLDEYADSTHWLYTIAHHRSRFFFHYS